ncbi:MAG: hypothetical protein WBD63_04310 [Phycisphaerae bacterium]|nr:hypothetical protein [Phycisphaerae bacterium]
MSSKRCAAGLVWLLAAALVSHAHAEEAAPNQPQTYYVIPIKGVIGRHFTAGRMEACLKEAERLKPAVVVLELDTGGGDIIDAERIVDLIIAHKDLRFVAFVRKALSAGATITLACEKIFVTESATIGGAVSYSVGSDGMPQDLPADVAEKFQSIWRAVCRKAAEYGGHPSLLAEAMVDPAFALTMREEGGKPVFERDGQGKVLKAQGRILTLTAREAVECTLAEELVPDLKAVGQHLGMPEWQEVGGRAGVQPADTGGPEKSASDPFAAPDALYEMLYQKVVSLGLTGDLTQIQEKKALEDWRAWFNAQRLQGRRVGWKMILVEASEGEVRMVPHVLRLWKSVQSGVEGLKQAETMTVDEFERFLRGASGINFAFFLAGGVRGSRMTVDEFEDLLRGCESSLRSARLGFAVDKVDGWAVGEGAKIVREFRQLQGESEAYPIKVTAKCDNEPRVFHMVAWVSARSKDALTAVAPESEIVLSGKIGKLEPYVSPDGVFLIEIILDQCVLIQEPAAGTSARDKDADSNCKQWLSLARNYIRAGMPEKAIPYLKQVIERYGDTDYAKEAHELEQEALEMIKARSEQENTPPTEGEPTPELTK